MNSQSTRIYVTVLCCLGTILMVPHFTDSFLWPHDANNAIYSLAAKNHLRDGLGTTLGANVVRVAEETSSSANVYINHPGTLSILVAFSFLVFGETEWAARLLPACFSIPLLLSIFFATRRRWGQRAAFLSSTLAAITPLFMFYGKMVNFEPLLAPLGIFYMDRISRAIHSPESTKTTSLALSACALFAACLIDYGGFFLFPAAIIAFGFRKEFLQSLVALGCGLFIDIAQIVAWSGTDGIMLLFTKGGERAGFSMPIIRWCFLQFHYLFFSTVGLCISLLALLSFLFSERKWNERTRFLIGLFVWGLGYLIAFRQAAEIHMYWQYFLFTPIAIAVGVLLSRTSNLIAAIIILFIFSQSLTIVNRDLYGDPNWYTLEYDAIRFQRDNNVAKNAFYSKSAFRTYHVEYYTDTRFIIDPALENAFVAK